MTRCLELEGMFPDENGNYKELKYFDGEDWE